MNDNMMECKTCGKEIAKSAKKCPHCGGNNKKPIFKRVSTYIVAVLVLLISLGLIYNFTSKEDDYILITYKDGATEKILMEEVFGTWTNNEIKFNSFDGCKIEVHGVVKQINGSYFFTNMNRTMGKNIKVGETERSIYPIEVELDEDLIKQFNVGDRVIIKGIISDAYMGTIYIFGNAVEEIEIQ